MGRNNLTESMRWWGRFCGLVMLTALLAGCGSSSAPATTPATVITRPTYHFALTIAANWTIVDEHDDATASIPYSIDIQRLNVQPGPMISSLHLEVIRTSAPGISAQIAEYTKSNSYHVIMLNGVRAYVTPPQIFYLSPPTLAPGQSLLPAATPHDGDPNTYTHTDYAIPTATYLYTLYTEAVAGDNAQADLAEMVQSLTITP